MLDFPEFLGRGIIAARAGKIAEAQRNLDLAVTIQPRSSRAWLWLAAVSPSQEQQRECLQKALAIDPSALTAKTLLERLCSSDSTLPIAPAQVHSFQCAQCGGQQRFDPDLASLTCLYCGNVEQLPTLNAANTEQDLNEALCHPSAGNWALISGQIKCAECGATILLPATQVTTECLFCGSRQVLTQSPTPNLVIPQAIAPFAFELNDASQRVRKWSSSSLFAPSNLVRLTRSQDLHGIYLPFWTFDAQVQIRCRVNYRVSPQVYSDTDRLIAYYPDGSQFRPELWYQRDFDDLLVYAGQNVLSKTLESVMPFNLKSVAEYTPSFLADWRAEAYQLSLADAAQEAYKRMRDHAMQTFDLRGVVQDYRVFFDDDIVIARRTFKLVLLPIWLGMYTYRGKKYQVIVNGQSGKVGGEKPVDWMKVGLAIGITLAFFVLIVTLAILIWNGLR